MAPGLRGLALVVPLLGLLLVADIAAAQDMPKEEYYTYVPLSYTRPVRQAAGTAALQLYGDTSDPAYVDENPVDGIDDRRHDVLQRMGVKFAPYLVLNTTAVPMDWKKFMDGRTSWPLYIDTWNQAVEGGELIREEQIDWLALEGDPCPDPQNAAVRTDNDDCRLLSLLEEFDPEDPQSEWYQTAAIDPQMDPFKVLYWNFPGHDEASWTAEYKDPVSGSSRRSTGASRRRTCIRSSKRSDPTRAGSRATSWFCSTGCSTRGTTGATTTRVIGNT